MNQKKFLITIVFVCLMTSPGYSLELNQLTVENPLIFDISGTLQALITKSQIDDLDDDVDIHRFRLNVSGKLNPNVSIVTEFELGGNMSPETKWQSGTGGTPRMKILDETADETSIAAGGRYAQKDMGSDSRLVQAYMQFSYFKKLKIQIGQMARGSNYELNTPLNKLETINYSTNVGHFGKMTRGIKFILSPFSFMKIGIGIDDSVGGITGGTDEPKAKFSTGAKIVLIPWKKHLSFKLCGRHVPVTNEMPDANGFVTGAKFKYKGLNLIGEFYHLHVNPANSGDKKKVKGNICSWYMHASYIIPKTKLQLVSRYNYFDKRMRDRNSDQLKAKANYYMEIITAGINYNFSPHSRLQVMYDVVDGPENDSIDAQVEVSF
ncbi:MAG: hypothetical protein OMM_01339 [Candidatus Magnetoglobus multicellularis str. Araruama]|uniref:Porin n=1 Tax=Candidatus Magnetoglobus multicellularis str. Araruama TaxID=890399 RepID=A0A1V1PDC5_9BACT|nr:MAG: hypothetical protein OMM_01339 [Candidatus Magnetoglobus multicellularis str. Araruama]